MCIERLSLSFSLSFWRLTRLFGDRWVGGLVHTPGIRRTRSPPEGSATEELTLDSSPRLSSAPPHAARCVACHGVRSRRSRSTPEKVPCGVRRSLHDGRGRFLHRVTRPRRGGPQSPPGGRRAPSRCLGHLAAQYGTQGDHQDAGRDAGRSSRSQLQEVGVKSESPGHVLRNHDRGQIRIRPRHFRHDGRVHDAQPFCSDHAALWVDH